MAKSPAHVRAVPSRPTILATGGAGYIGSHVTVELARAGYNVVVLENFENASRDVIPHIQTLAGRGVTVIEGDVRDLSAVERILRLYRIDGVIHLAGKKSVSESVCDPLLYFRDNVSAAVGLFSAMRSVGVDRLIFSSSATVYGMPESLPIAEDAPTRALNPYGRSKLIIEEMIEDLALSWSDLRAISLRYFNPVGAHASGLIGENPNGVPNNLFPFVAQTAAGRREAVNVFGDDYDTPDGTGIRDYIHVVDLARGHVRALDRIFGMTGADTARHLKINLGTGRGYSVLDVIRAFSDACGFDIAYRIEPRRPGDAAASLADPTLAQSLLRWSAEYGLDRMCRDHWAFQCAHAERQAAVRTLSTVTEFNAFGAANMSYRGTA